MRHPVQNCHEQGATPALQAKLIKMKVFKTRHFRVGIDTKLGGGGVHWFQISKSQVLGPWVGILDLDPPLIEYELFGLSISTLNWYTSYFSFVILVSMVSLKYTVYCNRLILPFVIFTLTFHFLGTECSATFQKSR